LIAPLHSATPLPPGAHAQPQVVTAPDSSPSTDPFITSLNTDPNDPIVKAYAQAQKVRLEKERELRIIRSKYFAGIRNTELRQLGISKLREFTDPAVYPSLLAVFVHEDHDVRGAILDHLLDRGTDEADATIAWSAVFDKDAWFRTEAGQRLQTRVAAVGSVSHRVKSVIAYALRNPDNTVAASAATLCGILGLIEAIPALINAQIVPGGTGGGGTTNSADTSLAYILIATQQAFVSDLTPVVGDSAVAFDPTLGVVTDGVYIRVIDAVVITYRTEVHAALVDLSTRAWGGRSTAYLGWDQPAWHDWYAKEYLPYRKQADEPAKRPATPAPTPGAKS
jgi:hypothetical protein